MAITSCNMVQCGHYLQRPEFDCISTTSGLFTITVTNVTTSETWDGSFDLSSGVETRIPFPLLYTDSRPWLPDTPINVKIKEYDSVNHVYNQVGNFDFTFGAVTQIEYGPSNSFSVVASSGATVGKYNATINFVTPGPGYPEDLLVPWDSSANCDQVYAAITAFEITIKNAANETVASFNSTTAQMPNTARTSQVGLLNTLNYGEQYTISTKYYTTYCGWGQESSYSFNQSQPVTPDITDLVVTPQGPLYDYASVSWNCACPVTTSYNVILTRTTGELESTETTTSRFTNVNNLVAGIQYRVTITAQGENYAVSSPVSVDFYAQAAAIQLLAPSSVTVDTISENTATMTIAYPPNSGDRPSAYTVSIRNESSTVVFSQSVSNDIANETPAVASLTGLTINNEHTFSIVSTREGNYTQSGDYTGNFHTLNQLVQVTDLRMTASSTEGTVAHISIDWNYDNSALTPDFWDVQITPANIIYPTSHPVAMDISTNTFYQIGVRPRTNEAGHTIVAAYVFVDVNIASVETLQPPTLTLVATSTDSITVNLVPPSGGSAPDWYVTDIYSMPGEDIVTSWYLSPGDTQITGLTEGTSYSIRARSYKNGCLDSTPSIVNASTTSSVSLQPVVFNTPIINHDYAEYAKVALAWDDPNVPMCQSYEWVLDNGSTITVDMPGLGVEPELPYGTDHTVTVVGKRDGVSTPSAMTSFNTGAPILLSATNVVVSNILTTTCTVSWNVPSNTVLSKVTITKMSDSSIVGYDQTNGTTLNFTNLPPDTQLRVSVDIDRGTLGVGAPATATFSTLGLVEVPVLNTVDPNYASVAEDVELFGEKFGTAQGQVLINGTINCAVTAWNNVWCRISVPSEVPAGWNAIMVANAAGVSNFKPIYIRGAIDAPIITDPTLHVANSGDAFVIHGQRFQDKVEQVTIETANLMQSNTTTAASNPVIIDQGAVAVVGGVQQQSTPAVSAQPYSCEVTEWLFNKITVKLPANVSQGIMYVTTRYGKSNGWPITIGDVVPVITFPTPTKVEVGSTIKVYGSNFVSSMTAMFIPYCDMMLASIMPMTFTSAGEVTVTLPSGPYTDGFIQLYYIDSDGVTQINSNLWYVKITGPSIKKITKDIVKHNDSVVIDGLDFGTTKGVVSFVTNDAITDKEATSWSDTSITINVPVIDSCMVVVTDSNGLMSNGYPLEVGPSEQLTITSISPEETGDLPTTLVIEGILLDTVNELTIGGIVHPFVKEGTKLKVQLNGDEEGGIVIARSDKETAVGPVLKIKDPIITSIEPNSVGVTYIPSFGLDVLVKCQHTGTEGTFYYGNDVIASAIKKENGYLIRIPKSLITETKSVWYKTYERVSNSVKLAVITNSITSIVSPSITSISTSLAAYYSDVEIYGANFGASKETGQVLINGKLLPDKEFKDQAGVSHNTIVQWSDSRIIICIPEDFEPGEIQIKVIK